MNSARWSVRMVGRVLVLKNAGLITLQSQMAGREALSAAVRVYDPGAVMVDLSKATLVFTPDDWLEMTKPSFWQSSRIDQPVAYVVDELWYREGRALCARMMEHDLLRLCFTDKLTALRWCAWHAQSEFSDSAAGAL